MKRIIKVIIENREDGGINVHSPDLPGLILSGTRRAAILADILPAAKVLLKHKGEDADIQIDASFVTAT